MSPALASSFSIYLAWSQPKTTHMASMSYTKNMASFKHMVKQALWKATEYLLLVRLLLFTFKDLFLYNGADCWWEPAIMECRWSMNPQKCSNTTAVRKATPWLLITQSFCQGWVDTDCWGITVSSKMSICRRGADKLPAAPSWQIKGEMDCNFLLKWTEDGKVKSCLHRGVTGMSDVDKAIYALVFIVLHLLCLKKLLLFRTHRFPTGKPRSDMVGKSLCIKVKALTFWLQWFWL